MYLEAHDAIIESSEKGSFGGDGVEDTVSVNGRACLLRVEVKSSTAQCSFSRCTPTA